MRRVAKQLALFLAVGCAAAATHWGVVVLAVSTAAMQPLVANVAGWLVAFIVSFFGHYRLTFRHQHAPLARAARRFFAVSALGFCVNELAYAWLLQVTRLRYDVLLALILIGIAGMTFILGRFWAFRRKN
jgi:putative flippase GtrA